jgi:alanine racemase
VATGDELVLVGDGHDGAPTAQDWAEACGTISYEIVTRMGARQPGRMPRLHVDSDRASDRDSDQDSDGGNDTEVEDA